MKTVLTRGKTRAFQTRRFFEFETNTKASILKSTVVYHLNGKNRFVNGLGIWWAKMPGLVIYILLTYNRPIYRERLGRARPDPWFQEVKNRPFARFSHMVQNHTCWDASCTVGKRNKGRSRWTFTSCFVLEVPLGNWRPRIVQRAYFKWYCK